MSEFAPPLVPGCPAVDAQQALTPDAIEALLDDFRKWLSQAATAAVASQPGVPESTLTAAEVVNQFVALRHEVNLQTKAVRAQQEQNTETLQQLRQALDVLAQSAGPRAQARDPAEAQRPLLKTLVDVEDALGLARREVPKLQEALAPLCQSLAEPVTQAPWWRRWLGRPGHDATSAHKQQADALLARIRALLESFSAGYAMGLQRIERAVTQHGLEPIAAVGCPFDPEQMEVVDTIAGAGRPAGEVVAEIRRGYLWNGRVFRFAQVQVTRD